MHIADEVGGEQVASPYGLRQTAGPCAVRRSGTSAPGLLAIRTVAGSMPLSSPDPSLEYKNGSIKNGQWVWHADCPENLIAVHEIYRNYITGLD